MRLKPVYVMGHLHALWHDALEQQEDGDLSAWSDELIAQSAQFDGDAPKFVSLLRERGWLDGHMIHDWLDYAGRYLESKYRTSNQKRLAEIWAKHGQVWLESDFRRSKVCPPNLDNQTLPNQPTKDKKTPSAPKRSGAAKPFWKELIAHLNDSWSRKKRGASYPWNGKDFAALKRILRVYQPFDVMALWDIYLSSDDDYARKQGFNVPEFIRQIPRIVDGNWKAKAQQYADKFMPANPAGVVAVKDLVSSIGKEIPK